MRGCLYGGRIAQGEESFSACGRTAWGGQSGAKPKGGLHSEKGKAYFSLRTKLKVRGETLTGGKHLPPELSLLKYRQRRWAAKTKQSPLLDLSI